MNPVSVKVVAEVLGMTPRRVQQLVAEGLPQLARGEYDLPAVVAWHTSREVEKAKRTEPPDEFEIAKTRKMTAEAALAEYELAEKEAQVVALDVMEKLLSEALYRLRAKMLVLPSKWAPSLVGCRTVVEAQVRLEAAVAEAMLSLSETGEEEDEPNQEAA